MSDSDAAPEVITSLTSAIPNERLRAVRRLAKGGDRSLVGELRYAREREPDSWVQTAMDQLLRNWQDDGAAITRGQSWITIAAESTLEDIRAEAIQTVTQTLLHEIRPLIGDLKTAARRELNEQFASSRTSALIERTKDLLATIQKFHEAAAAPCFVEFDLSDAISRCISLAGFDTTRVLNARQDSVNAVGDPDLLTLALVNALKNAVEASENTDARVIINCAVTDTEAWVVVLDEGVGLPDGIDDGWKPGRTNKSKERHFGWGLSIAQRAVHSLGGIIKLSPRDGGGTSCEIRWKLDPEEDGG